MNWTFPAQFVGNPSMRIPVMYGIIDTLSTGYGLIPVGPSSILALAVVVILLLLTQRWIVGMPEIVRRVSIFIAPWLCLPLYLGLAPVYLPSAADGIAIVVSLVFGFAFSLEHFRVPSTLYRAHGSILSFIHGTLLVVETITWTSWYVSWGWFRLDLIALAMFWILLLVVIIMLNRHVNRKMLREKGCCVHCGYDLRGNVSGVCPECGNAIDPEVREKVETI